MDDSEARRQQRRGYWMRLARTRAGMTLAAAAEAAGLRDTSGSTITRWESGGRPVKMIHLERLARAYGVPLSVLTHPEPTDEERLEEAIQSASAAERQDWQRGAA